MNDQGEYIVLPSAHGNSAAKGRKPAPAPKIRFDAVRGTANMRGMSTNQCIALIRGFDKDEVDTQFSDPAPTSKRKASAKSA